MDGFDHLLPDQGKWDAGQGVKDFIHDSPCSRPIGACVGDCIHPEGDKNALSRQARGDSRSQRDDATSSHLAELSGHYPIHQDPMGKTENPSIVFLKIGRARRTRYRSRESASGLRGYSKRGAGTLAGVGSAIRGPGLHATHPPKKGDRHPEGSEPVPVFRDSQGFDQCPLFSWS
jgi:hypothetical protein